MPARLFSSPISFQFETVEFVNYSTRRTRYYKSLTRERPILDIRHGRSALMYLDQSPLQHKATNAGSDRQV